MLLTQTESAVRLAVQVQPGAKRNAIIGVHGDALKIAVTAPPVDGKANDAVVEFVAECFGISRRLVSVASGHTSRRKVVAMTGLSLADAQATLHTLLAPTR